MKIRPKIRPGDLVKFSKKNPAFSIYKNDVFVVKKVLSGNGAEAYDEILIKDNTGFEATYSRDYLWFTGKKIKDYNNGLLSFYQREQLIEEAINITNNIYKDIYKEPKDNDGRKNCFKCNSPTKEVSTGFTKVYNICPKCKI